MRTEKVAKRHMARTQRDTQRQDKATGLSKASSSPIIRISYEMTHLNYH